MSILLILTCFWASIRFMFIGGFIRCVILVALRLCELNVLLIVLLFWSCMFVILESLWNSFFIRFLALVSLNGKTWPYSCFLKCGSRMFVMNVSFFDMYAGS